ncbi:peroxisome biogenesis protein 3-2-like isoform X1 [Durio zibethinus]|uniref:Peroxisome biogenesis protein 3-2-like isoform X1 n=1 Tax=Durio zibethinus TaxID=66656 RepID=A0A6P6AN63_DURZI|nr:peroxisome biogenesis protein 3-2-like isoform X1 [Durio zibethinus]XP_022766246.1 peroxisome biogenesis protein 3-2-like isoform X1 [Durio zibethinus]
MHYFLSFRINQRKAIEKGQTNKRSDAPNMLYLRNLWRRHRRKVLVTAGVLGSGYFLYKLYDAHKRRLTDLERQLASERENDEFIKARMQVHFENIQRIADTTTLPHSMHYLSCRIAEDLDLSHLTERLTKGKGQPNSLSSSEKLELWDRLKILSFTRMVVSIWAVTMLSLYIRVQVNILGRHLYIDTARGLGSSHLLEDADLIDREEQQKFLASADFLANYGLPTLLSNMQIAVTEVLKAKQLRDFFDSRVLHQTIMQILDMFMSMGSPRFWVDCLMPEDPRLYKLAPTSSSDKTNPSEFTQFDQLMVETREVLSSAEFDSVVEISLKAVVNALVEEKGFQSRVGRPTLGMPLARLLPLITQICPTLLDEPSKNQFIQIIQSIPEVGLFFTLLYTNMSTS